MLLFYLWNDTKIIKNDIENLEITKEIHGFHNQHMGHLIVSTIDTCLTWENVK